MQYRRATLDDVPLLARWNHQLIRDEGHPNPMTQAELATRMRGWLAARTYTAVLFEQSGTPVAYALYRDESDAIYLRHFFVSRDHRRQGIGRAAMRVLLAEILPQDKRVRLEVLASNPGGHAFWRAVGFEDYSTTMLYPRM